MIYTPTVPELSAQEKADPIDKLAYDLILIACIGYVGSPSGGHGNDRVQLTNEATVICMLDFLSNSIGASNTQ
jgi:hypothetical protein